MDIATAYVQIIPSTEGIESNLTSALTGAGDTAASSAGKSAGGKFASALGTAAKVGVGAVGVMAAGVTAASAAFVGATNELSLYGDAIDKNSQKLGISAEAYQEWGAILQHSGSSASALRPAMKTLQKEAQSGSEAFQKLGLSQEQVASMSKEDLFSATITGLQGITDENERATLATELLGRGAVEMGALLNTSAEDTEAMRQKVHELGGVMSDEAVKAAAKYKDTLQDMTTAMDGLKRNLVSEFLPSMTTVMEGLTDIFTGDSDKGLSAISEGIDGIVSGITEKIPTIMEIGGTIVQSLITAITNNLPSVIEAGTQVSLDLLQGFVGNLPSIMEAGVQAITTLASGIGNALPTLIPSIVDAVLTIVDTLIDNMPMLIEAALQLMIGLAEGLINAIPVIIERLPEIVSSIVTALINAAPKIAEAGVKLFTALVTNLPKIIADIVAAIPKIITSIVSAIGEGFGKMVEAGKNLLAGLGQGILDGIGGVVDKVKNAGSHILGAITDFFGINSPSKVFAGLGEYMMEGLAQGIEGNAEMPERAINGLSGKLVANSRINVSGNLGSARTIPQSETNALLEEWLPKLAQMSVIMDTGATVGQLAMPMDSFLGTKRNIVKRELLEATA